MAISEVPSFMWAVLMWCLLRTFVQPNSFGGSAMVAILLDNFHVGRGTFCFFAYVEY